MRSSNGPSDLGEIGSSGTSMRGSLSSIPAAIDLRGMSGLHSRPSRGQNLTNGSLQNSAKAKPSARGLLDACSGGQEAVGDSIIAC